MGWDGLAAGWEGWGERQAWVVRAAANQAAAALPAPAPPPQQCGQGRPPATLLPAETLSGTTEHSLHSTPPYLPGVPPARPPPPTTAAPDLQQGRGAGRAAAWRRAAEAAADTGWYPASGPPAQCWHAGQRQGMHTAAPPLPPPLLLPTPPLEPPKLCLTLHFPTHTHTHQAAPYSTVSSTHPHTHPHPQHTHTHRSSLPAPSPV